MINAWSDALDFSVPEPLRSFAWQVELDTAEPGAAGRRSTGHRRAADRALADAAARPWSRRFWTVQPLDTVSPIISARVLSALGEVLGDDLDEFRDVEVQMKRFSPIHGLSSRIELIA